MVGVPSRPKGPASSPIPSLQKSASKDGQKTLLGFWQKKTPDSSKKNPITEPTQKASPSLPTKTKTLVQGSPRPRVPVLTPAPSSDALEVEEDTQPSKAMGKSRGLPSPLTPALSSQSQKGEDQAMPDVSYSSPSRRVSPVLRQITHHS